MDFFGKPKKDKKKVDSNKVDSKKIDNNKVSVVGMACRFPGGVDSPDDFWNLLINKKNTCIKTPENQYVCPLKDRYHFDYEFFKMSKQEADLTDPQALQILEIAMLTFLDAGYEKNAVKNSDTAVFIGAHVLVNPSLTSVYSIASHTLSAISGRVSYIFGLYGSCATIDCACSSSLVCVDLGINSIIRGDSEMSLVGGTNIVINSDKGQMYKLMDIAGMLSPTGASHTFDRLADGFVRGEGAALVLLKKTLSSSDRVHAIISASQVAQDGNSTNLHAPNGLSQQMMIKKCIEKAMIKEDDITFIECHGTGTKLGDPIEVHAIRNTFKDRKTPLYLGAVKTNIGHLETAAGIAGLIKVILCLKHLQIPPNLHFQSLNPEINLKNVPIKMPNETIQLDKKALYGGVSSFGFTGTLSHVIVEMPDEKLTHTNKLIESPFHNRVLCTVENHGFPSKKIGECEWIQEWTHHLKEYISDHKVGSVSLVPGTCYIEMLLPCIKDLHGDNISNINFKNIYFKEIIYLQDETLPIIKIKLENGTFHIYSGNESNWTENATISYENASNASNASNAPKFEDIKSCCKNRMICKEEFYGMIGNHYKGDFKRLNKIWYNNSQILCEIDFSDSNEPSFMQTCAWVDIGLQTDMILKESHGLTYFIKKIESCWIPNIERSSHNKLWAFTQYNPNGTRSVYTYDENGNIVNIIENIYHGMRSSIKTGSFLHKTSWIPIDVSTQLEPSADFCCCIEPNINAIRDSLKDDDTNHIIIHSNDVLEGFGGFIKTIIKEYPHKRIQWYIGPKKNIKVISSMSYTIIKYVDGVYFHDELGVISRQSLVTFPYKQYSIFDRGDFDKLTEEDCARNKHIDPDEVEICIRNVGLNFRDVLNVLDMYPGDPGPVGWDMCGTVTRKGSNVHNVEINDRVLGFTIGSMRDYNTTHKDLVVKAPSKFNDMEAASLPVIAVTVELAFYGLYEISSNDIILIHAGAGGVGLVAIEYAKRVGATILATVGSDTKKHYLESIGIKNIFSSRDAEKFREASNEWKGKVTIVLNSLVNEFIPYSMDLLCQNGYFMEIGKREIWDRNKLENYRADINYCPIAADTIILENPQKIQEILCQIVERFETYDAIPATNFDDPYDGLRFLKSGSNIGKVCWQNRNVNDVSGYIIITGGNGALGKLFVNYLLDRYPDVVCVVLTRSLISTTNARIVVENCNLRDLANLENIIEKYRNRLVGIIHAAGVLRDNLFENTNSEDFDIVYETKAQSAKYLAELTKYVPLKFFVLCSSIASAIGNPGQSNYAYANSVLDDLAENCKNLGINAHSIQWGPWDLGGDGMANADVLAKLESDGIGAVTPAIGLQVLQTIIDAPLNLPSKFVVCHIEENDDIVKEDIAFLNYEEIGDYLHKLAIKTTGNSEILYVDALMDSGLDSLSSVEYRNNVQKKFGIPIDSTIIFDYPTIEKMAKYLYERLQPEHPPMATTPNDDLKFEKGYVAISGMSCRLPGGVDTCDDYWELLSKSKNCSSKYELFKDLSVPYICSLRDKYMFDNVFFGLSDEEAMTMNPQGKQILEVAYLALLDAGLDKDSVFEKMVDVYIGVENFSIDLNAEVNVYTSTSVALSCISGRLSFLLGLKGASMCINTACSSSLVSVDLGVKALQGETCDYALVGGVNIISTSHAQNMFCKTNLLSPDGQCYTFDSRANGYVRGEGVGMMLLQRQGDVNSFCGLIRGSAVQQDGKSSSLTAPNGPSQELTIKNALNRAGLESDDISYIECHGTGTALGDPIEVHALRNVFQGREKSNPLYLGAVKSNIGHLETAAGIAGLIKLVLCLQKRRVPPNINFKALNPKLSLNDVPLLFPTEMVDLPTSGTLYGGVSSFGFSGTLAHIIVEGNDDICNNNLYDYPFNNRKLCNKNENKKGNGIENEYHMHKLVSHATPNYSIKDLGFIEELKSSKGPLIIGNEEWGTAGLIRTLRKEYPNWEIAMENEYVLEKFVMPIIDRRKNLVGTVVITGGNGGFANVCANYLLERYSNVRIVLVSRSINEEKTDRLSKIKCDITDQNQVSELFLGITDLVGVVHAAGILRDGMFKSLSVDDFESVINVKYTAAKSIFEAIKLRSFEFLILTSSIAAGLGNVGQSNYAMANSMMDAFAVKCDTDGYPVRSVQWGALDLNGKGMANDAILASVKSTSGIVSIEHIFRTLDYLINIPESIPSVLAVSPIKLLESLPIKNNELASLKMMVNFYRFSKEDQLNEIKKEMRSEIKKRLVDLTGKAADKYKNNRPLDRYGMDSLAMSSLLSSILEWGNFELDEIESSMTIDDIVDRVMGSQSLI